MYIEKKGVQPDTIEARAYQINIADAARECSTMVVLPTGMGKTIVALMVMADVLQSKGGKVLFMAPTKPLVEQHARFIRESLEYGPVNVFTGEVGPDKRQELWNESRIVCSTPQVVVNDLIAGRTSLSDVDLLVVDEAHRAVGDYAYVFVGERYKERQGGLVLAATASPGSDVSKILEVCENLGIEHVEIRSKYDADVLNYVHDIAIEWKMVDVPESLSTVISLLKEALASLVKELKGFGVIIPSPVSTKKLLEAGNRLRADIQVNPNARSLYRAIAVQAAAVKLNHAIELAETQGVEALRSYMQRLLEESGSKRGSKASRILAANRKIMESYTALEGVEDAHPKMDVIMEVVAEEISSHSDPRIIVFTHYRETAEMVTKKLSELPGVRPVRFVGQASKGEDKGLRQKQQVETIQHYRDGKYNVLVATSVAEEGLDIPSTDLVIFYEPVPSEIRTIQRRGRTGRKRRGRVVVLMAKGTRDQGYYFSSNRKEKLMQQEMQTLKRKLSGSLSVGDIYRGMTEDKSIPTSYSKQPSGRINVEPVKSNTGEKGQRMLIEFSQKPVKDPELKEQSSEQSSEISIVVDSREFNSSVVKELSRKGARIQSKQLAAGDYIVSSSMGVERKDVDDFLASLLDGRLFSQMADMNRAYLNPVLILEGGGLVTRKNISPASIYGALASIVSDFRISVLCTENSGETANMLYSLASRGGIRDSGGYTKRHGKPGVSRVRDAQLYAVEGLPGVSAHIAKRLLEHFGTVENVFKASEEELQEVKGIGKKTAQNIRTVLRSRFS